MMDNSIVASLIEFEAEEVPFWGNDLSIKEMIEKITVYQTKFLNKPVSVEANRYFLETFLHRIITEEGQSNDSLKNLKEAYQYLKSIDQDSHGLLDVCLIKNVHKLILNSNDAGKFSKKDRITCFKGELYMYAEPQGLEAKVQLLNRSIQ